MIVPIVMLAIKDSAADMSPYVRKTAAHAIPKLYRYIHQNACSNLKIMKAKDQEGKVSQIKQIQIYFVHRNKQF